MFDLPTLTAVVLFGFPALWVLYTIGFLVATRRWADTDDGEGWQQ